MIKGTTLYIEDYTQVKWRKQKKRYKQPKQFNEWEIYVTLINSLSGADFGAVNLPSWTYFKDKSLMETKCSWRSTFDEYNQFPINFVIIFASKELPKQNIKKNWTEMYYRIHCNLLNDCVNIFKLTELRALIW